MCEKADISFINIFSIINPAKLPSLIKKRHLLEHHQKVSKEKDFSDFENFRKLSAILLRVCPSFCSQYTSKNTINSIKQFQVDQNVYHTDEDNLNQFRKYFSNFFSKSF